MNQDNVINVELKKEKEFDILEFQFENPVKINLNSSNNKEIKEMFEMLLKELIKKKFILELKIQENYKTDLYKDVCTEYIKALNEEIKETIESNLWKEIFEIEGEN
ncbi:MAG: hypothetical protein J6I85_08410 [Clostridia bacterium]|nr:hypothetical protein [Clostridia bacterium]